MPCYRTPSWELDYKLSETCLHDDRYIVKSIPKMKSLCVCCAPIDFSTLFSITNPVKQKINLILVNIRTRFYWIKYLHCDYDLSFDLNMPPNASAPCWLISWIKKSFELICVYAFDIFEYFLVRYIDGFDLIK